MAQKDKQNCLDFTLSQQATVSGKEVVEVDGGHIPCRADKPETRV